MLRAKVVAQSEKKTSPMAYHSPIEFALHCFHLHEAKKRAGHANGYEREKKSPLARVKLAVRVRLVLASTRLNMLTEAKFSKMDNILLTPWA